MKTQATIDKNNFTQNLEQNLSEADKFFLHLIREDTTELNSYKNLLNDKQKILRDSINHKVTPYLYLKLGKLSPEIISDKLKSELQNYYLASLKRTTYLTHNLKEILQAFEKADINCLVLKGPLLSEKIYPRPDLRLFSDLDLLVKQVDLERAINCLAGIDYKMINENTALAAKEQRGQCHLSKEDILIDLHWEIINDGLYRTTMRYKAAEVFETSCVDNFMGSKMLAMTPIELVIYQGIHLSTQHAFAKLAWFNDLHLVLKRFSSKINWDDFVEVVKKRRIATQTHYALLFTKTLLNSPVPEEVITELKPKYSLARFFEFSLKHRSIIAISKSRRNLTYQIWLILRDNWYFTLKALMWRIFPSIDWFINYYPFLPKLAPAYYILLYPLLIIMRLFVKPRFDIG